MITESKASNAVGGKTARACDSCLRKRARWYCGSDDAFLCQGCDSSVHSANQLASRHERVRLGTASFKATATKANSPPAWHHGFTRKPRTQRQRKDRESVAANTSLFVPEIGSEEASNDDTEEQLLCRVPVFDPFDAELSHAFHQIRGVREVKGNNGYVEPCDHFDNLNGLVTSDMELAEFAADVESLLGTGLDDDSCRIQELGPMDCKEDCFGGNRMKVEDEEVEPIIACYLDPAVDMPREMLDWNFDYESTVTGEEEEEEEKAVVVPETKMMNVEIKEEAQRKILLRLNYEEIITVWDNQRCPWTTGCRPEFNPNDCWPDFMGIYGGGVHQPYGSVGGRMDGGREARVSRYREKRRTRLFSKKIRYEVRKLNAEKRPRMKGRFVKRTSFVGRGPSFPQYLLNK